MKAQDSVFSSGLLSTVDTLATDGSLGETVLKKEGSPVVSIIPHVVLGICGIIQQLRAAFENVNSSDPGRALGKLPLKEGELELTHYMLRALDVAKAFYSTGALSTDVAKQPTAEQETSAKCPLCDRHIEQSLHRLLLLVRAGPSRFGDGKLVAGHCGCCASSQVQLDAYRQFINDLAFKLEALEYKCQRMRNDRRAARRALSSHVQHQSSKLDRSLPNPPPCAVCGASALDAASMNGDKRARGHPQLVHGRLLGALDAWRDVGVCHGASASSSPTSDRVRTTASPPDCHPLDTLLPVACPPAPLHCAPSVDVESQFRATRAAVPADFCGELTVFGDSDCASDTESSASDSDCGRSGGGAIIGPAVSEHVDTCATTAIGAAGVPVGRSLEAAPAHATEAALFTNPSLDAHLALGSDSESGSDPDEGPGSFRVEQGSCGLEAGPRHSCGDSLHPLATASPSQSEPPSPSPLRNALHLGERLRQMELKAQQPKHRRKQQRGREEEVGVRHTFRGLEGIREVDEEGGDNLHPATAHSRHANTHPHQNCSPNTVAAVAGSSEAHSQLLDPCTHGQAPRSLARPLHDLCPSDHHALSDDSDSDSDSDSRSGASDESWGDAGGAPSGPVSPQVPHAAEAPPPPSSLRLRSSRTPASRDPSVQVPDQKSPSPVAVAASGALNQSGSAAGVALASRSRRVGFLHLDPDSDSELGSPEARDTAARGAHPTPSSHRLDADVSPAVRQRSVVRRGQGDQRLPDASGRASTADNSSSHSHPQTSPPASLVSLTQCETHAAHASRAKSFPHCDSSRPTRLASQRAPATAAAPDAPTPPTSDGGYAERQSTQALLGGTVGHSGTTPEASQPSRTRDARKASHTAATSSDILDDCSITLPATAQALDGPDLPRPATDRTYGAEYEKQKRRQGGVDGVDARPIRTLPGVPSPDKATPKPAAGALLSHHPQPLAQPHHAKPALASTHALPAATRASIVVRHGCMVEVRVREASPSGPTANRACPRLSPQPCGARCASGRSASFGMSRREHSRFGGGTDSSHGVKLRIDRPSKPVLRTPDSAALPNCMHGADVGTASPIVRAPSAAPPGIPRSPSIPAVACTPPIAAKDSVSSASSCVNQGHEGAISVKGPGGGDVRWLSVESARIAEELEALERGLMDNRRLRRDVQREVAKVAHDKSLLEQHLYGAAPAAVVAAPTRPSASRSHKSPHMTAPHQLPDLDAERRCMPTSGSGRTATFPAAARIVTWERK